MTRYFRGQIRSIVGDRSFVIVFDDAAIDMNVPAANIQRPLVVKALREEEDGGMTPFDDASEHDDGEVVLTCHHVTHVPSVFDTNMLKQIRNAMPRVATKHRLKLSMLHWARQYRANDQDWTNVALIAYWSPSHTQDIRDAREEKIIQLQATLNSMTSSNEHLPPIDPNSQVPNLLNVDVGISPRSIDGLDTEVDDTTDSLESIQVDELRDQYHELLWQHDVLYPGATVLLAMDEILRQCTIRQRYSTTLFDVQVENSHKFICHVTLSQLIAAPKPLHPTIRTTHVTRYIGNGLRYDLHERVLVQDEFTGGFSLGYVTGFNSNDRAVVDFVDGTVDGCARFLAIQKADAETLEKLNLPPPPVVISYPLAAGEDVLVRHPHTSQAAIARIIQVYESNMCDIQFADNVVLTQVTLSSLHGAVVSNVNKPPAFAQHDYVMAYNPRFNRYCTGQVTASVGRAYTIVFDYGETYDVVPHDCVTWIWDTSVLGQGATVTTNWTSSNGFEADAIECSGDPETHNIGCLDRSCSQFVIGEAVLAPYSGSAKYFAATVLHSDTLRVNVKFQSQEIQCHLSPNDVISIDGRHDKPIRFELAPPSWGSNDVSHQPGLLRHWSSRRLSLNKIKPILPSEPTPTPMFRQFSLGRRKNESSRELGPIMPPLLRHASDGIEPRLPQLANLPKTFWTRLRTQVAPAITL
ncbi:Aste57867_7691 [Aphanomyces stellatus]|uniref:Aste57867_7691 protein n=1 Tax=Aphanomyces stellatus TaxID=120398 RepID=A0A485KIM6_9STRA|nr:hypothetical protein As57867_007662 [Aphanomyces stellatus]VFT84594.1 Aste57867_7691 [Aphanomyces stellatus]